MRFLCVAAGRRSLPQLIWTREGGARGMEGGERRCVSLRHKQPQPFHRYEPQQVRCGPKRLSSDNLQQDDRTV